MMTHPPVYTASLFSTHYKPTRKATPEKQVVLQQTQTTAPQPHFGSAANGSISNGYRKLLNHMDFRSFGTSYLNQIQVVYAGCIGWRLVAANERRKDSPLKSWNEIRENALRDSMGYVFWFFATPMLQRGILSYISKKHDPAIGNSLCKVNPEIANGKGFFGKLKAWNPLYRIDIPSSEQVKNQMEQAKHHLREAGILEGSEAFQKTEAHFKKLFMYRNIATGLGLINTIALIGIGINLLNFYLTRKNVERRKMAMQRPTFPTPPPLPKQSKPPATSHSAPPPAPPTPQVAFPAASLPPTAPNSPFIAPGQILPNAPYGFQPPAA